MEKELNWFFKQATEYGGTAVAQQLSTMNLNKIIKHCYGLGLHLNRPMKTIERLRGSSTLIPWLVENNEATSQQRKLTNRCWTPSRRLRPTRKMSQRRKGRPDQRDQQHPNTWRLDQHQRSTTDVKLQAYVAQ